MKNIYNFNIFIIIQYDSGLYFYFICLFILLYNMIVDYIFILYVYSLFMYTIFTIFKFLQFQHLHFLYIYDFII